MKQQLKVRKAWKYRQKKSSNILPFKEQSSVLIILKVIDLCNQQF